MWNYQTSIEWKEGKRGIARCGGKPDIAVATPPEFGGPEGIWTPEDLVAASVGSCIMTSALFFIDRAGIELQSYESGASAVMEKTPSGLAITKVTVEATVSLKDSAQENGLRKAMDQAEKNCPVSALLKCPVELTVQVNS